MISSTRSGKNFQDLVAQIHQTLIVAPTPQIIQVSSQSIGQSSADGATIPGKIEIPSVPSNQRQSHLSLISDDTIVVVGQAQKKRKRTKSKVLDNPSIRDREDIDNDEAFDYDTVPNLLDDIPPAPEDLYARKKKKQKDAKAGAGFIEYGEFRAPPRDLRQVKDGNKTHTFR